MAGRCTFEVSVPAVWSHGLHRHSLRCSSSLERDLPHCCAASTGWRTLKTTESERLVRCVIPHLRCIGVVYHRIPNTHEDNCSKAWLFLHAFDVAAVLCVVLSTFYRSLQLILLSLGERFFLLPKRYMGLFYPGRTSASLEELKYIQLTRRTWNTHLNRRSPSMCLGKPYAFKFHLSTRPLCIFIDINVVCQFIQLPYATFLLPQFCKHIIAFLFHIVLFRKLKLMNVVSFTIFYYRLLFIVHLQPGLSTSTGSSALCARILYFFLFLQQNRIALMRIF